MKEIITAAIDVGTTTISAVVLDVLNEKQLETFNIPNDAELEGAYPWEHIQDADKIVKRAELLLHKINEKYPHILSLGFTGQMHGILYLDSCGKAVSPLYTWQDGRGDQLMDGRSYAQALSELTGYPMSTGYGLTTHFYNIKNGNVPHNAYTLCSIMDYLVMHFTGNTAPKTHPSVAASFGLFDVEKICFDADALAKAGIDIALPQIVGDEVVGRYGKTQVTPAIGDNQASVFGSVADEAASVLVNYGTGSQVSVITDHADVQAPLEVRPYIGGKKLICGCALCGGSAYAILEGFFKSYAEALGVEGNQYKTMDILASKAYNGKIKPLEVNTLFKGTRQNANLRGAVNGIASDNFTPEALILGLINGMATELYQMYALSGIEGKTTLVASGNGVQKNEVLQRVLCDTFGMELMLPCNPEEAATGAAMYSLYCLSPDDDILADVKACIEYK